MGRDPKKRKKLTLIGIVCDDEIKDFNFKPANDKPKTVRNLFLFLFLIFCVFQIGC
jgi:hypothetical protein